jgi:uncharacterized protein YeaO (DUF488 family)
METIMPRECHKCGDYILDCWCKKYAPGLNDKFFYQGKFFKKEKDFRAYVKEFNIRQTTAEDFGDLFDMLKKDVWMNLSMRATKISNGELRTILEEAFELFFTRILDLDAR